MKYIDTLPSADLDTQAQMMLQDLKFTKLPGVLTSSNLHNYSIPWVPGGISVKYEEHARYLILVCDQVYSDVKRLIDNAANKEATVSKFHREVLHHAFLCKTKCESYCDRRDGVMARVEYHIKHSSNFPLIIHGKSGSGKTSIMAKIALSIPKWRADDCSIVLRFLGTSPMSSSIRSVLVSTCEQICTLFGVTTPDFYKMDTIEIIQLFRNQLLSSLNKKSSQHVVILLDSVDQLAPTDSAHSMKWIPVELPPNVQIVISVLDVKHNCLENLKTIIPYSGDSYINVGQMHVETGEEIMNVWLSKIGRRITDSQKSIISTAFLSCPQPLFLRLLFGHARTWTSYIELNPLTIPMSIQDALSHFYNDLESQFGKVLVQKALGYVTASKHGLTEAELEDVLSLDNEVLNDVYQYWDPPVKGIIRIPSLLWKRIRHFIDDYIVEQQADGMTVLVWYHRQFIESANERYVTHQATKLHYILAEFFDGAWENGRGKSVELTYREICLKDANRQVASQPLLFGKTMYNLRKLNALPFHLLHSHQVAKLKEDILCNYEWVYTKLKATSSYTSLMHDYVATLSIHDGEGDISLTCETLALAGSILRSDPDKLAGQLMGRLYPPQTTLLHKLLDDADDWISKSKCCTFRPMNNCLISPGGELKGTLSGHPQLVLAVTKSTSTSLPLLVSYSKGLNKRDDLFQVWNMTTLECIENVNTFSLPGTCNLTSFNLAVTSEHLVAVNGLSYAVWNLRSGNTIEHSAELDGTTAFTCVAVTQSDFCLIFGTATGALIFKSISSSSVYDRMELKNAIRSILITSDERLLVVLAGNDQIVVVNKDTHKIIKCLGYSHTHFDAINVASIDTQSFFLAGDTNGLLHIFDLPNLEFRSIEAHTKVIKTIIHIPSMNCIVTGSLDNLVHIWDLKTWSQTQTLKGHVNGVWCLCSIPGTKLVVSGSKDDYLKVWDMLSGKCLHTLEGHSSWISCVTAIASDVVVSGSNDKTLKIWHLRGRTSLSPIRCERHNAHPECILLKNDVVAVSGAPDAIKVWNPLNGKCMHSIDSSASCLTLDDDNDLVISGSKGGSIEIYSTVDPVNFSLHTVISRAHENRVTCLLHFKNFSENVLVSSSLDSTLKIWNTSFELSCILTGHTAGVICLARSLDMIASGSQDSDVRIWKLSTSECIMTLEGHIKAVNCVTFTSVDNRLISGGDDNSARVWNISDSTCLAVVNVTDSIKCVCSFDTDSIFVAGAHCGKNQLKSWSINNGQLVKHFIGHSHAVMCMLVIDESHFLTGSRDGTVRVWNVKTAEMLGSFDLQSQVKHVSLSRLSEALFLLAATTMSGPIAFLQFNLS